LFSLDLFGCGTLVSFLYGFCGDCLLHLIVV